MITLEAVVEVAPTNTPAWPVAPIPQYSWLVLDDDTPALGAALFVALLADYLRVPATDVNTAVEALLAEEALILAGGLRVRDTSTGVSVAPGCCFGLEDWRDWAALSAGETIWLGHDPTPSVERVGELLRIRQDADAETFVDLPAAEIPALLTRIERDLSAFLTRLGDWTAAAASPDLAARLVAVVDHHFHVTAP